MIAHDFGLINGERIECKIIEHDPNGKHDTDFLAITGRSSGYSIAIPFNMDFFKEKFHLLNEDQFKEARNCFETVKE